MKAFKNLIKTAVFCSLAAVSAAFLLFFQTEQAAAHQSPKQAEPPTAVHNKQNPHFQLLKEDHEHNHQDHQEQPAEKQTAWNLQKAENLRQKMMIYRPSNQGRFKEYWVGTAVKWKGTALPNQVISNIKTKEVLKVSVDGKSRQLQYSKTGDLPGWNVVAVFSNQNDAKASKKHTYFFIIKDGKEAQIIEPVSLKRKHIVFTSKVSNKLLSVFTDILAHK